MERILVTGADGFVGRALTNRLLSTGYEVRGVVRCEGEKEGTIAVGDIADYNDWSSLLVGVDVVVHLAARAHILRERTADPLQEFKRVNVGATLKLARAAATAGVRRFIFMSSIGVNGRENLNQPFAEFDEPNPSGPYGLSKWEAERGLIELSAVTDMGIIRIRPPLILGCGVKGNLRRLIRIVDSGLPLPFRSICNRRNFVALEDLCELLRLCVLNTQVKDELFLVAGEEEISTPDLLRQIAKGLGRRARLFSMPLPIMRMTAELFGVAGELRGMVSSLCLNAARARTVLGWMPRGSIEDSINAMARSYRGK